MSNQIYPCLWFDGQAKAAANFYCSIFSNSSIVQESPIVTHFEIEGKKIMALDGGPMFKINQSISLFVTCTSEEEIEDIWYKLIVGGSAMMPLDKYPWSEKYGWLVDQFGMTWQLILDELPAGRQKIVPLLLFVGKQFGHAQQAIKDYSAIFQNSQILHLELYPEENPFKGNLMFGRFSLNNTQIAAMDGPGEHHFEFNEGISLVVECETQEEIDHYWDSLTKEGSESQCGWLRDKYGVSWQIIPGMLGNLMSEPQKGERVMNALLKMKKLDIAALQGA